MKTLMKTLCRVENHLNHYWFWSQNDCWSYFTNVLLSLKGAMADEFRSADGRRDLYSMYTRASEREAGATNQQSEFRSTARKTLILPPATTG